MNRCGGNSRKFSRLEQDDSDERSTSPLPPQQQPPQQPPPPQHESPLAMSPQQDEKIQRLSPSSPSRRKRILQSLANCSPSRKEKVLVEEDGRNGAFPSAAVTTTTAPKNGQVIHPQTRLPITTAQNYKVTCPEESATPQPPQRQQQQLYTTATTTTTDRSIDVVVVPPSRRIPSMYDNDDGDEARRRTSRNVFRPIISKENGVGESVKEHPITPIRPTPAKPAMSTEPAAAGAAAALLGILLESVESQDAPTSIVSSPGPEPSAIQVESLSEIEALIARVKRLDEVVQAGEASFTTTTTTTATATTRDDETIPALFVSTMRDLMISSSEFSDANDVEAPPHEATRNMLDRSPYFQPIDKSEHCSLDEHAEPSDRESETSSLSPSSATEVMDGGVDGFKVGSSSSSSNSPLNRVHAPSTVVSSSFATVSSFGIPTMTPIYKPLPISPRRQSHASSTLTAHSFFWRTYPRETFTSYGPNRPKTKLSLLNSSTTNHITRPKEAQRKFLAPAATTTRIRKRAVVTERDKVDDASKHEPSSADPDPDTFGSAESDPVLTKSQDVIEELTSIKSIISQYKSRPLSRTSAALLGVGVETAPQLLNIYTHLSSIREDMLAGSDDSTPASRANASSWVASFSGVPVEPSQI